MTEDIKKKAEKLAGPHAKNPAQTCRVYWGKGAEATCSCGQAERVAAILALMQENSRLVGEIDERKATSEEQWKALNEATEMYRAAEAKVRELESEGYKALLKQPKSVWLDAIIEAAKDEARDEGRKAGLGEAAKVAEAAYSCTCDVAYTERGLIAPDCFKHQACDEVAADIRALAGKEGA